MDPGPPAGALVERETELRRLDEFVAATASRGQLLLISGPAGTGKSSLLAALRAACEGVLTVRFGRCEPLAAPAPFGPLYEMLPALPPEVTGPLQQGAHRELVFAGLLAELRRTRNLFAVDDLHWADEATIDLIRYLARRIEDTRTLLVCAYRADELDRTHPLQALLGEVGALAERMELRALTVDGVAQLVADRDDVDPLSIYSVSGGNPFFVTQLLSYPGEELPPTVEEAVVARTRSLSPTAWEVLDAAGLSPDGLPLPLLERLAPTAVADVDAAIRRGLLCIDAGRVRARHELIRLALAAAVPPARRRRIHLELLRLLADRAATPADVATLAHHAVGSGDGQLIITHCLSAGRRAATEGSHREAILHYEQVLAHRDLLDRDQLVDVLDRYYYECYLTGDLTPALAAVRDALELSTHPSERGRHLRCLSRLSSLAGDLAAARRYGHDAVAVLERDDADDPHELAFAYSNLAQLAMLDGDRAETRRWGGRALELAQATGDVEVVAHALNNLGMVDPRGVGLLEQSLELALAHGFEEHAARAYTNLSHEALLR